MAWFAYPEDRGTTGSSTEDDWDWNASANLATLAEESHLTDHILDGFDLSWDGSSITVSKGIAKVTYSGGTTSYADNEDRPWPVTFVAGNTIDASYTKAADTVWDVYVTFDLAGGDSVSYVFDDTNTAPTADVVLFVGTIDTTDGTVVDDGPRVPDIEANTQSIYEAIEYQNGGSTGTLQWSPSSDQTLTLPDTTGTVATLDDTGSDSSVSDDSVEVVSAPSDLNFTTKLNVTDDGDGTVSIDTTALNQEEVEDAINSVVQAGTNVTTSYDDANGTLTINSSDTTLTNEEVEDVVGTLVTGGTNVTVTYDDAGNTLTVDATDTNTHPSASDDGTQVISSVDDLNFGDKLSVADDGDSTVTVSTSALDTEEVEDAINSLLTAGSNVSLTYDDANGSLTVAATDTDTNTQTDVSDSGGTVVTETGDITFTASNDATVSVTDDGDGTATVDVDVTDTDTDTDTHTDVSDDGTLSVGDVADINFGSGLAVTDDTDGSVTIDTTGGGGVDVEDDGTAVVSGSSAINFGSNVSVVDDGDGTVTVSASSGGSSEPEFGPRNHGRIVTQYGNPDDIDTAADGHWVAHAGYQTVGMFDTLGQVGDHYLESSEMVSVSLQDSLQYMVSGGSSNAPNGHGAYLYDMTNGIYQRDQWVSGNQSKDYYDPVSVVVNGDYAFLGFGRVSPDYDPFILSFDISGDSVTKLDELKVPQSGTNNVTELRYKDGYLWAGVENRGVYTFDVSSPSSISYVDEYTSDTFGGNVNVRIYNGNVYTQNRNTPTIYALTDDPTNITKVGEWANGTSGFNLYNIAPRDDELIAGIRDGNNNYLIASFDISDPTNITERYRNIFNVDIYSDIEIGPDGTLIVGNSSGATVVR